MFDRSSSHRVWDGRVANVCYEGCSQTGYRENQGTIKVCPVVEGLVQSVELRTSDASRSVRGSLTEKGQRIEDTACRIHDDIVGHTILRITLLEDLIVDDVCQCSGDVVRRVLRKVTKSGLTGPDAQVWDPPGWSADEDSIECIGRDLHLFQSLTTTCGATRIVGELVSLAIVGSRQCFADKDRAVHSAPTPVLERALVESKGRVQYIWVEVTRVLLGQSRGIDKTYSHQNLQW